MAAAVATDPWADFRGDPTLLMPPPTQPQQPASSAASASAGQQAPDPWADFKGTPTAGPQPTPASPAAPSWQSVEPRELQPGEPGYAPGSLVNLSPADWSAFYKGEAPPVRPVTGPVANLAAGANEAIAGTAGLPVDLVTGGINLATRGINAVAGTAIPPIVDPVGGSASIRRAMGVVGANPDNVVSSDGFDRAARAVGQGAASAMVPAGGAALAVRTGLAAAPAAEAAVSALGAPTVGNTALSAGAALGGQQAADLAPEPWKPLANTLGALTTGAGLAGVAAARHTLTDYLAPRAVAPDKMSALSALGGEPIVRDNGTPVTASPGQVQAASGQLRGMMADPAAAQAALEGNATLVPGSAPTTFQATSDPLLGQYERGAARSGPEASAAFTQRSGQQNDARVAALRGIAPDGSPEAVAAQARALDPTPGAATSVARAQGGASAATDALGGNLPAGSDAMVGTALRAPIAAANVTAKEGEGALWRAIDPDGTLGVPMGAIRNQALNIVRGESPNAAPMAGAEREIFQTATQLPDAQSFRDLSALRSRITDTIRAARSDPAQAQSVRRLSILLDGVHDAMADTASKTELPAAGSQAGAGWLAGPAAFGSTPQAASGAPAGSMKVSAPGVGSDVFTPAGQRIGVRYEVVPADSLVASHGSDMTPNPAYPAELQPRDRTRAASEVQVANIASRLQPERLGASSTAADGAPIVGPDGVVESGNGRVLALRRAYQADGPQAQGYRDWLAGQGHDTAGMQQPVLIRRRTTDLTPAERVAFAEGANAPTVLGMSATERAAQDARRLPDDVLHQFQPGDVTDPTNRDAVRGFVRNVVEPGQEGGFVTADGQLSQEGAARVRAALVHRAYGDGGLSAALAESTDPAGKVLAGAMQDAAGPMAQLSARIKAGEVDPAVDIAPGLVEAAQTVQRARQRGVSLADAVAQRDLLGNGVSPQAEDLLRMAYGPELRGRMSREGFADTLASYARRAQEQSSAGNLFGANLTADQILDGVSARYGQVAGRGSQGRGFAAGVDGQSSGGRGGQARGPVPGAGREEAPGGSGGQGRDPARVLEQAPPALTPTWDAAAADRYAAARAATVDRKSTYQNAPGVGEALRGGSTAGGYTMPDHAVPAAILTPGPAGAARAQAYLQAGGSLDALHTAAAFALRRDAMRDGTIDLPALQRFQARYGSALSAMPELRASIDTASRAQQVVEAAQGQYANDTRAFQGSLLGKLAGSGGDPTAIISQALRNPTTGIRDMRLLAAATANNADARAGLQRAVVDGILKQMQGDQLGVGSTEATMHAAQFQKFIRQAAPALRQVMSPKQMETMEAVAADMQRSNLSVSGTRVPGGSDTVQNRSNVAAAGGSQTLLGSLVGEGKRAVLGGGGIVTGAGVGGYLGGPLGAVFGAVTGAGPMVLRAVANARAAGIENVNDLVREAMLNPELARVLLAQPTPKTATNILSALAAVLGRASLLPDSGSTEAQRRVQTQPPVRLNALSQLGAAMAPAPPTAASALGAPR